MSVSLDTLINDHSKKMYSAHKVTVSVNCHLPQTNCFIIIFINVAYKCSRGGKTGEVFSFSFFLSDSAVSTHAPSSALQEIRKEKRLTAQFHKTPPRHHFIFSQPFFSFIYLFHCLLKNKQSDNSGSFSGNLSFLLPCYALLSPCKRFNPS